MRLLATLLAALFNLALALYGAKTGLESIALRPLLETIAALLVQCAAFAGTALYAFGLRAKFIWLASICLNVALVLGSLIFIGLLRAKYGADGSGFSAGLAGAGVLCALNLAYLLWHRQGGNPDKKTAT